MLDVEKVRKDFPILKTGVIYLDSTASSLTPEPVLRKVLEFYHQYRANTGRGIHHLSQKASAEYERARAKVADFINARSENEIIMTRNTTEGINLIATGLKWKRGEKIVTSLIEHHSNFVVWLRTQRKHNAKLEIIRPKRPVKEGILDVADFEKGIDDKTRLVTLTHVSNVLGVITPIKEITKIAHEHGAYVLVDGAQSVPHIEVDAQNLGCDFLAFSGHKMCAPTGSGALYIREELTEDIEPLNIGGGTIADVGANYYKLSKSPKKFEAGTQAIAETIGLGAAIDYLQKVGIKNIEQHERKLTRRIYTELMTLPAVEIYGPSPEHKIGITAFNINGVNPHDVALELDVSANIMVRSGHHCALPLTKDLLHQRGTIRASTYFYNTEKEIDRFTSALKKIKSSSV